MAKGKKNKRNATAKKTSAGRKKMVVKARSSNIYFCKNNYFWDENDGCVASTENLNQATKKLEQLKSLLDKKLKTLNNEQ